MTPEAKVRIAEWQAHVADGSITNEELREAIAYLRALRANGSAPKAAKPKVAKSNAASDGADEALKSLGI